MSARPLICRGGRRRGWAAPFFAAAIALAAGQAFCLSTVGAETLTLEDCLRETALHNPMVVQQARALEAAAGTRLTFRSRGLPSLGISGVLGQQGAQDAAQLTIPVGRDAKGRPVSRSIAQARPSQFIAISTQTLYQPIFDVGVPASWRRGNLETATSLQNYYSVAVTAMDAARLSFNQTIYNRELGNILGELDRAYGANTRSVEALVNAGLTGRQALLQAQTQRAEFAPSINAASGSYRTSLTTLLSLMGREQRGVGGGDLVGTVRLEGSLDAGVLSFDPRAAAAQALAERPDFEYLRLLARRFREDSRITRAGYYPLVRAVVNNLVLPGSFVRSSNPNSVRTSDQTQTSEVLPGARFDWNVIDTGTVRGAARASDVTSEGLEISLKQAEETVSRDLARLRAQLDAAAATLHAVKGNLAAAQDTLNIVTATVAEGTGSQLEFDNAQMGLLTTRTSQLDAQYAASKARAEFDRITGKYLRFVPAGDAPGNRPAPRPAK